MTNVGLHKEFCDSSLEYCLNDRYSNNNDYTSAFNHLAMNATIKNLIARAIKCPFGMDFTVSLRNSVFLKGFLDYSCVAYEEVTRSKTLINRETPGKELSIKWLINKLRHKKEHTIVGVGIKDLTEYDLLECINNKIYCLDEIDVVHYSIAMTREDLEEREKRR